LPWRSIGEESRTVPFMRCHLKGLSMEDVVQEGPRAFREEALENSTESAEAWELSEDKE
jgi:hypothetical protein